MNNFTIIIDSREQSPYQFPCPTVVEGLPAGDYSVVGFNNCVAIERKTKSDAYGTIGMGRERFIRELEKLTEYDYAAIVIECSFSSFLRQPYHSKLSVSSAVNSLLAWSVRYRLPIFFCCSRKLAQTCTLRLLEKFYRDSRV